MPYVKRKPTYKRKRSAYGSKRSTAKRGRPAVRGRTKYVKKKTLAQKKKSVRKVMSTKRGGTSATMPIAGIKQTELARVRWSHKFAIGHDSESICHPFTLKQADGTATKYYESDRQNGLKGNFFDEVLIADPLDPYMQEFEWQEGAEGTVHKTTGTNNYRDQTTPASYRTRLAFAGPIGIDSAEDLMAGTTDDDIVHYSDGYQHLARRYCRGVVHSANLRVTVMRYPARNYYVANPQIAARMLGFGADPLNGGQTSYTANQAVVDANPGLVHAANATVAQMANGRMAYMREDYQPSFAPSGDVVFTTQFGFDRMYIGRSSARDMAGIGKIMYNQPNHLVPGNSRASEQILVVDTFDEIANDPNKLDRLKYWLSKGGATTRKVEFVIKYDVLKGSKNSAHAHLKALDNIGDGMTAFTSANDQLGMGFFFINDTNLARNPSDDLALYKPRGRNRGENPVARWGMMPESNFTQLGDFSVTYELDQYILCSHPVGQNNHARPHLQQLDKDDGDEAFKGEGRTPRGAPLDTVPENNVFDALVEANP